MTSARVNQKQDRKQHMTLYAEDEDDDYFDLLPTRKKSKVNSYVLVSDIDRLSRTHQDLGQSYNQNQNKFLHKSAGERADAILQRMKRLYFDEGNTQCKPTAVAYTAVMKVWAKCGKPQRAEQVFQDLQNAYDESGRTDEDLCPNVYSYNAILDAWARCAGLATTTNKSASRLINESAAERAQNLLESMMELHSNGTNVLALPNAISFNTVLLAWSNQSGKQKHGHAETSAQKAEALLQRMEDLKRISYSDVRPSTISFSSVITAWARSGSDIATERADYILQRMMELSRTNKEIQPNTITLNAILDAWSLSNQPGAAAHAEDILSCMQDLHPNMKPDTISYNTVLKAWSKSGDKNAAEKAEACLERMINEFQAGNEDVKPNRRSFNTVIAAWSRDGGGGSSSFSSAKSKNGRTGGGEHESAVQRAEAVLLRMIDLYKKSENGVYDDLKPDVVSFTTVMNAWARSNEPRKAKKTLEMLHTMQDLADNGHINGNSNKYLCRPNVITYNTVLNACAYCFPGQDENALLVAVTAFNELRKSSVKPDAVTYGMFMKAVVNLMPRDHSRNVMVRNIWNMCKDEGQVSDLVLSQLRRAVPRDVFWELVGLKHEESRIGNDATFLDGIPQEWTRNAMKKNSGKTKNGRRKRAEKNKQRPRTPTGTFRNGRIKGENGKNKQRITESM